MKPRRKIIDLKNSRKLKLDEAQTALNAGNVETYTALMSDVTSLNTEIENYDSLIAEQGRFADSEPQYVSLAESQAEAKTSAKQLSRLDSLRNEREYAVAWAEALRNGMTPKTARSRESMKPLLNALTVSGGDPEGSKGGFLVPLDFDNLLHEYEKDYFDLSTLFSSETVVSHSGWRAFAVSPTAKLRKIAEGASIGKEAEPSFVKVTYTLDKYAERLAVSNELLNAETVSLMDYIARWFSVLHVNTKNSLLIALLDTLAGEALGAGSAIADMKTALHTGLNTANARSASILTNQSGFNIIDNLLDANGRPMLVPNPADPDTYRFAGKPITYTDDDLLANAGNAAPIYLGNFAAFGTLFSRGSIEIASTDVGGDAWDTATNEIRALCFMDVEQIDKKAALKRTIAIS